MKDHIKDGLRIFGDYGFVLIFDLILLGAFINWMLIYSTVMLLILTIVIYSDTRRLAIREKKSWSKASSYSWKGFAIGLIGMSPIYAAEMILVIIALSVGGEAGTVPILILNTATAPLYAIYKILGKTVFGYIIASLFVPLIAGLGYFAGFKGFDIRNNRRRRTDEKLQNGG